MERNRTSHRREISPQHSSKSKGNPEAVPLGRREQAYRDIFESAPVGIFTSTPEGKMIEANPALARILGYDSPEELISVVNRSGIAEQLYVQPERRVDIVAQVMKHPGWVEFENQARHTSGAVLTVQVKLRLKERSDGSKYLEGYIEDITDRKRAEEALEKARLKLEERVEERTRALAETNRELCREIEDHERTEKRLADTELEYRTVAEFTYDWEYWQGPDGSFRFISPSCERVTGYKRGDFVREPGLLRKIILAEDLPLWDRHRCTPDEQGRTGQVQFRIRTCTGEVVWIEHVCQPVRDERGRFLGIRASNRDITDRVQAKKELVSSESFLKTVLGSLTDNIAVIDREGTIVLVNEAWLDFACNNGLTELASVLPGSRYLHLCQQCAEAGSEDARAALEGIRTVLEGKSARFTMEYECSSPEEQRWFSLSVVPLLRPEGGAVIAHTDITRRKKAEEEARRQADSLAEAQRIVHLGSWDWNISTNNLFWSDEVYRIFGLKIREFEETYDAFLERVHPGDRHALDDAVKAALADPLVHYSIQHRIVRPDGTERTVHERGEVTFDETGKAIRMVGTVQDITERRAMELESRWLRSELQHRQRVETLGALTAALAHEINQPLAAILSNAQAGLRLLNTDAPDIDEVREALQDIVADDKRAGEIIRRLRAMYKKEERSQELFDLNKAFADMLGLIRSEVVLRNTVIERALAPSLPPVTGDSIQIQQVIMNVLINALEAVAGQPPQQRFVKVSTSLDGQGWVIAAVSDTGPGIHWERIDSVFDPFATDKADGIGVGLAICRSIIEGHKGHIWAENRPEGGTTVSFRLPVC